MRVRSRSGRLLVAGLVAVVTLVMVVQGGGPGGQKEITPLDESYALKHEVPENLQKVVVDHMAGGDDRVLVAVFFDRYQTDPVRDLSVFIGIPPRMVLRTGISNWTSFAIGHVGGIYLVYPLEESIQVLAKHVRNSAARLSCALVNAKAEYLDFQTGAGQVSCSSPLGYRPLTP